MLKFIKRKLARYQQRRTFQEYGFEVSRFDLLTGATMEYAQWLHPFEGKKIIGQAQIDFYRAFLKPGELVIDIGAHTGDTSVPMGFAVGPSGCVLAIEPNKHVYKILQANAKLNPAQTNIIPLNFAVTERDGTFDFHYSDASFCNGGFLSEIESNAHNHKYTLAVEGRNLEDYLAQHHAALLPRLGLLKVDAEGYDKEILKSMHALIQRWQPFIIAECYKKLTREERFDLYDTIVGMGYTPYRIGEFVGRDEIKITRREDMLNWPHMDMLLLPAGKVPYAVASAPGEPGAAE